MKFKTKLEQEIYFFNKTYLGDGSEGKCYKLNDIDAAKIFYKITPYKYVEERLLQFQNIKLPAFSFAKEIIYLKEKIIGIIYPYMRGVSINERSIDKAPIVDLCIALDKLLPQIKELSELGIMTDDVASRNTVYFYQEFSFIDTSCYQYSDLNPNRIFNDNCQKIMLIILNNIFGYYMNCFIEDKLKIDWQKDLDVLTNPVQFILEIKNKLEGKLDFEIDNFGDVNPQLIRKIS